MANDIVIYPDPATGYPHIDFSGATTGTISLEVHDDGSVHWTGSSGTLFSLIDDLTGVLSSVNNISGLPVFEVNADNSINMGEYGNYGIVLNSDQSVDFGNGITVTGTAAATTVTGANVTSGTDPGHTHSFYALTNNYGTGTIYAAHIMVADGGTANRDYIRHDDTTNTWHFVSDGYVSGTGNSNIYAAGMTLTGTMAATTVTGANVTSGSDPGHTHTAYEASGAVSTHSALTTGVHGVTGTVLGTEDVDDTPVNGATTAPVSSNWAYDYSVVRTYTDQDIDDTLLTYVQTSDVDDVPVNGVTGYPISSNWAYDHVNGADPHSVYGLLSAAETVTGVWNFVAGVQSGGSEVVAQNDVDDTPVDGATTAPISSNWAYDYLNSAATRTGSLTIDGSPVVFQNVEGSDVARFENQTTANAKMRVRFTSGYWKIIPTDISDGSLDTAREITYNYSTREWDIEGSNIITAASVDDTPVNGATTAPVSSNWAYDHAANVTAHRGWGDGKICLFHDTTMDVSAGGTITWADPKLLYDTNHFLFDSGKSSTSLFLETQAIYLVSFNVLIDQNSNVDSIFRARVMVDGKYYAAGCETVEYIDTRSFPYMSLVLHPTVIDLSAATYIELIIDEEVGTSTNADTIVNGTTMTLQRVG